MNLEGKLKVVQNKAVLQESLVHVGLEMPLQWGCQNMPMLTWSGAGALLSVKQESPLKGQVTRLCTPWLSSHRGVKWDV